MNEIARLEYKLAYYNSAVHRFNHYTTRTPPPFLGLFHFNLDLYLIMLSVMQGCIKNQFLSFWYDQSPGLLANTLLISSKAALCRLIGLVDRVFTNGPGDQGYIPGHVIPKTSKMILDTSLLNTQQYKVRIKGKVEQSRERSSTLPYTSV